ncbi:Cytochrome c biogenesis protein CcsA [Phycisphaerales bacterium]|nr:Cytochrome c biogenesis protein CcsA [Phycisphaerales bacterium]
MNQRNLDSGRPFRGAISGLLRAVLPVIFAFCVLVVRPVRAQNAPEGNAHPRTQAVNESGLSLPNPFGEHSRDLAAVCSTEDKAAFAATLNLEPLRDLAVFHNGRVKILDTLARETVREVTGRSQYRGDYLDPAKPGGGAKSIVTRKFDPLFTLLDMTIDPAYYADKPLVGVDFLPLRRELLEVAFPEDAAARDRWLRLGRVSPRMIDQYVRVSSARSMSDDSSRRALGMLDEGVSLFLEGKANFVMVAPAQSTLPWSHLSRLDPQHPVRVAAAAIGQAWRARDSALANQAIASLASELPKINAEVYPAGRRTLERLYNRSNAFEWGFWTYGLALVTLLVAFGTARPWLARAGAGVLFVSLALHAFGFVTRCLIAERFAIQNQFESMTGLSLFAVVVGASIMLLRRQWLFGAAAAGVGFLVLITATQTNIPGQAIEREAAILNTSVLLKYHVTTVLSSYGLIALGFVVSLFYLGVHYAGILRPASAQGAVTTAGIAVALGDDRGQIGTRLRLLADLDTAQMVVLQLAFWTLGVGILLGAWWADHSWGRWWAFDPKETWALITWIVYLIVIHVRVAAPGNKGLTTAWLSVVGFGVMLWTYFGVNLLLPGLHAYA